MSALAEQALENGWARAHEVGMASVFGRCLKAGMGVQQARQTVELCKDKREPHVYLSKVIKRWRAEG